MNLHFVQKKFNIYPLNPPCRPRNTDKTRRNAYTLQFYYEMSSKSKISVFSYKLPLPLPLPYYRRRKCPIVRTQYREVPVFLRVRKNILLNIPTAGYLFGTSYKRFWKTNLIQDPTVRSDAEVRREGPTVGSDSGLF